jgi:hypothetical protein
MARDYRAEYDKYQGTPEQKKNRAKRNAARAKLAKVGKVKKGDGMDVAHVRAFDKGGSNGDGLRVEPKAKNRSFKRDSKGNLVSEGASSSARRTRLPLRPI